MRTTLGVSTYNGAQRLSWLLRSVWLRPPWPDEVVIVDDGSPRAETTRQVCTEWSDRLPIVHVQHASNRGISAGWNSAARGGSAELVILANDDVIVSDGWLEGLTHPLKHSPGVGVVGQNWHAFTGDDIGGLLASKDSDLGVVPRDPVTKAPAPERRTLYEDTNPGRVMAPTGQLFAFRRSDFDAIGGFDEAYKSFYEESCMGTSMCARGMIGLQTTWPFCWHMWSKTFSENPELHAGDRLAASKAHYRAKWNVPDGVHEFDYTNPKYLGAIGDVEVEFLRKGGKIGRGILRQDGAFIANDCG